jgi:hypothetical protein
MYRVAQSTTAWFTSSYTQFFALALKFYAEFSVFPLLYLQHAIV